ncbi:ABC-type sugar transport system, periplasmic component [Halobacteroides halobius DSM 5150]|uniref:ABC-type sugar transport system, periplasmic component n=1 Tax=Halobacteroides halobius (strain ATCC 35273 / DSM 5150 / MD-1) TaxID=748449 RepID=L0K6G7_HALHC|nr:extracellular solute-binding protein [Halobacteroides halobius]AGB40130.1 ABC-type sugar transport system, periplasmic component [Halobacteroides halobius DSM 5150]
MKKNIWLFGLVLTLVLVVTTTSSAWWIFGNDQKSNGKITLEFFQNKQEAVDTYNQLIKKFEKSHPKIDIKQNNVPSAETVLKTRLAKNDIPAIMGLGANFTYGQIAEAGILANFSDDPQLKNIQPAYLEMTKNLHEGNKNYGIPYSANANTILYNKTKFKKLGLEIPKTWNELIATAKKIEQAGEIPFYLTFKDAWTAMIPWNSLAANLQGENFIDQRKAGETTFQARYQKVAKRIYSLLDYGQQDIFGKGYNAGNKAFAKGKSVMYLQGIWAISSIKKANPNIKIGAFALPAVNDASKNKLVSGVDTVLTMSSQLSDRRAKAAKEFIHFLIKQENTQYYINQEKLFSAVKGVYQKDPQLVDLKEYFETGQLAPFPDHYYPAGMQVPRLIQKFLLNGNIDSFLERLDKAWNRVQAR